MGHRTAIAPGVRQLYRRAMTRPVNLDPEARAAGLVLSSCPALTRYEQGVARESWRRRMAHEQATAEAFTGLAEDLALAAGAIAERHQARLSALILDERRHALRSAEVLVALGGAAVALLPELLPAPESGPHSPDEPLEAILSKLLSLLCSETVGAARTEAEAARRPSGPPEIEERLGQLARDEARHARLCWLLLEELHASPGPRTLRRNHLDRYLIVALAHLEAVELSPLANQRMASAAAESVGVSGALATARLIQETVARVIAPGLDQLGLDARAAWRARRPLFGPP
jgi:hypothetical protein